jgi:hypothetical protein
MMFTFLKIGELAIAIVHWLGSFLDPTQPKTSANFLAMLASTTVLCYVCVKIALALALQVEKGGHVTMPDVCLLATACVPLAALAGAVYSLKPDGSMQVGDEVKPPTSNPNQTLPQKGASP